MTELEEPSLPLSGRPMERREPDTSFMWRCAECARLHLSDVPIAMPQACLGCGAGTLTDERPLARRPGRL
jgi:hypothetical protein